MNNVLFAGFQANMEFLGRGTSLSRQLIGVGEPQIPTLTPTFRRAPPHTTVNYHTLWCVAAGCYTRLLCICQILKLIGKKVNWGGSQTNISTLFVRNGDNRALCFVGGEKVSFTLETC